MTLPQEKNRLVNLAIWVRSVLAESGIVASEPVTREPVSGDAGFRQYFRIKTSRGTMLAVDAPPSTEDSESFVAIARHWRKGKVRVPEIFAFDFENGFMLVEDFGDVQLRDKLTPQSAERLYSKALLTLNNIQLQSADGLPEYSKTLLEFELSLYPEWFITRFLGLNKSDAAQLDSMFECLVQSILEQPVGTVHRDYHSRNLMLCADGDLGVIDFQGALKGSLLYDPVSLLRDCYQDWPAEKVEHWFKQYAARHPVLSEYSAEKLKVWFDLTGLQRHLKCLGIFARLWLRDNKPGYLPDIPRTFNYVLWICAEYPQLEAHGRWLTTCVKPILEQRIAEASREAGL